MNILAFIKNSIKRYLLFGIVTFIPFYITIIVLFKIVNFFDSIIKDMVKILYLPPMVNRIFMYPGSGVFLSVVFLILIGFISRQYLGKGLMQFAEKIFTLFPISKQIYLAVKKMTESLITKDEKRFKRVVMVPFPHKDVYAIGFLTGKTERVEDNKKFYYVYVPTAINPTSGFLINIREDAIIKSDMTVEEAFALILSGGIAATNNHKNKQP